MGNTIYLKSSFCAVYLENEDEETLKKIFYDKIKEFGFENEKEVLYFLDNYRYINYSKDNINKYIDVVDFFGFDIKKDFIKHLSGIFKTIALSDSIKYLDNLDKHHEEENRNLMRKQEDTKTLEKINIFLN